MENRKTQKYFTILRTLAYLCIIAIVLSSFYSNPKQNSRKVEEYTIVFGGYGSTYTSRLEKFKNRVNRLIDEGWEPIGGVSAYDENTNALMQAMVRYSE